MKKKTNTRRILFPFLSFLFLPSLALPAEGKSLRLDWDECLLQALKNNPELKSYGQSVEAAKSFYKGSLSGFFPKVAAQTGVSREKGIPESRVAAKLEFSQSVFAGGGDWGRRMEGKALWDREEVNFKVALSKLWYDLKVAYANLLYVKEQIRLAQSIASRRAENVAMVDLKFQSGRESRGPVLLGEAFHQEALLEQRAAERSFENSKATLLRLLGWEEEDIQGADLRLDGSLAFEEKWEESPAFYQLALNTPDYLLAQESQKISEAKVTVAKAQYYPAIDLTGTLERSGRSFFPDGQEQWKVGINLTFPLISGGSIHYGVQKARADLLRDQYLKRSTLQIMVDKLKGSFAHLQNTSERLSVHKQFLEAAKIRSEMGKVKYANGLISFEEWNIIEGDLIDRQKAHLTGLLETNLAYAEWVKIQGKGGIFP